MLTAQVTRSPDLAIFVSSKMTTTQPITFPLVSACGVINYRNILVNQVCSTGPSSEEAVGGGLPGMVRSTPIRGILHVRIGSRII